MTPFPKTTLLKNRRTKIIATIGPASREPAVLRALLEAGVDVCRLNMSHGGHDEHRETFQRIRAEARALNKPIAILADLCGPKIRAGRFANGSIHLEKSATVTVTTRDLLGTPGLIPCQYQNLANDLRPGDRILLDDGLLELRVESITGPDITCIVIHGGLLKDRKGINLPGVNVSEAALTDKDLEDARFVMELGIDYLALSFVRRAEEVRALRAKTSAQGSAAEIIAKIEKPEAFQELDAIIEAADGIMVARGDLGVEMPPEVVPIAQHELVKRTRAANKPVIVATQMLESMIESSRPTRAEVSDVSHAVFAGADAVMLSAETAAGAYPVEAVQMMDRVARQVEGWQWTDGAFRSLAEDHGSGQELPMNVAVARSTAQLSRDLRARAIVVLSRSGTTASFMSGARPGAPIMAVTSNPDVGRRMNLLWGVFPIIVAGEELQHPHALARRLARDLGLAGPGQPILVVAGVRIDTAVSEPVVTVLSM